MPLKIYSEPLSLSSRKGLIFEQNMHTSSVIYFLECVSHFFTLTFDPYVAHNLRYLLYLLRNTPIRRDGLQAGLHWSAVCPE
jgi:hypothetical protein